MRLPLIQQILLDVVVPPIGATFVWLRARGWATTVQGGSVSEKTKRRQKIEFWLLLFAAYVLMFGITLYGLLTRH